MKFCLNLDLHSEKSKHLRDFEYASHLFKVLEAVAVVSSKRDGYLISKMSLKFFSSIFINKI